MSTAAHVDATYSRSRELQEIAHRLIPGGSHTYAKGDDQYPELSPGFIARGQGSHVWDVDGNEFIEYGMGCRAVTLGHAFAPIVEAVRESLDLGTNFTRPAEIEVECAQQFLSMVPGAEMVKFTKDGSAATTAALKLARAHTGRPLVAFCHDHPFFASNDWFIGTTPVGAGVPEEVRRLSVGFRYGDLDSVAAMFRQHQPQIAGLIMEPTRGDDPGDFLRGVQRLCQEHGTVFILDEMITGFRWHNGGAQSLYQVTPDLSTFGKAMANGFSISALTGKAEIMELGGLQHDRPRVFLLSTTHGAELPGLTAGLAVMRYYEAYPVVQRLHQLGQQLRGELDHVIQRRGLADFVSIEGRACNLVYAALDETGRRSQAFRSLLLQELIRRGVLAPSLVISYSHTDEDIRRTAAAFDGALEVYGQALNEGVDKFLVGRPSKVVMRQFN